VIGATAFPAHGYARATLDVDLFIDAERANAENVHAALAEFGYDVADLSVDDLIAMKKAAGRSKDLEDLRVLLELKARQSR
jgi:predicted nucleotidyltransferase